MDEYTMSWSEAVRAESSYSSIDAEPPPAQDVGQFGTLGRALWLQRSFARLLARGGRKPEQTTSSTDSAHRDR